MNIVFLKPRSGYVTDLRSVTLWGTICWCIRYLHGDTELVEFIERCKEGNPDFIISSAFPFKQQGATPTLFFPNPLLHPTDTLGNDDDTERALISYRLRKKLKKIEFICQTDFEEMLHGKLTTDDLFDRLLVEHDRKEAHRKEQAQERCKKDYIPHENTVAQAPPMRHDFSMTHNTIDRLRGGTLNIEDEDGKLRGQLFHANDVWWSDPFDESESGGTMAGLFFLVEEYKENSIEKYITPALRLLEHWGIGADRTIGKGFFEFEIEPFTLLQPSPNESNALLSLSLYSPKDLGELSAIQKNSGSGFYPFTLENRECKGWTEKGGFEKDPALFFAEGSVFPRPENMETPWLGGIHKNTEVGHTVYDNGFGFMVNLKWQSS